MNLTSHNSKYVQAVEKLEKLKQQVAKLKSELPEEKFFAKIITGRVEPTPELLESRRRQKEGAARLREEWRKPLPLP
jgi:hypothetical protein